MSLFCGYWRVATRPADCWIRRVALLDRKPPCQPFSVAGKQSGADDERHLAPIWLNLIKECRPPIIFGEQVADAIRHGWLDDLLNALEREGYACGAAVLPACSVGAPHIRKRLFFGAIRLEYADLQHIQPARNNTRANNPSRPSPNNGMAHASRAGWRQAGCYATGNRETYAGWPRNRNGNGGTNDLSGGLVRTSGANSSRSFWSGADWLGCRDGKFRPVEPGTQPLAYGVPARVGRLRGYGNAIVPQAAAAFVKEFLGACAELQQGAI